MGTAAAEAQVLLVGGGPAGLATAIEARRRGHTLTEQQLTDGSIKLRIQINGGAA